MLKFPFDGGIVTIRSTILIPAECPTVVTSSKEIPKEAGVRHENFKVAPHPNFPNQEVAIGYSPVRQKKRGQAPEHTKAIQTEVQKLVEASLNGKLASLNRFLSKSAKRSLPLFKTLKKCIKNSDFHWTPEAEQAFKQLKQHLSELPLLVAPKPKEELNVYMSASHEAISAVLMTEKGTVQTPVYFVSRALQGLELNYIPMEKLVLSRVFAAKRLRRSGAGLILTSPKGTEFTYALRFGFTAYNNEAEYEALIVGLQIVAHMGVHIVHDPPGDRKEASKLHIKARQYELLEGVLYRRSFLKPWLRDARDMIRTCNDCQIHRPVPRNPQQPLTPITAPWPFYKWGIDIAGPFPEGPGKVKTFMWDNIVCRFGLSGDIVSHNGKQFSDISLEDWCEKLNITQCFASVKHPQSNGLVERANGSLGEGIKARLGEGNKN
ncbi:reverse transcriptase domain-containing protein [Tanacetum coccineum]